MDWKLLRYITSLTDPLCSSPIPCTWIDCWGANHYLRRVLHMHLIWQSSRDRDLRQGWRCMRECRSGSALRRQEGECMSLQQPRASTSIQTVSPLSCQRQRQGSAPQAMEHPRLATALLVRNSARSVYLCNQKTDISCSLGTERLHLRKACVAQQMTVLSWPQGFPHVSPPRYPPMRCALQGPELPVLRMQMLRRRA